MLHTSEEVRQYVIAAGMVDPSEDIIVEALKGGVSCLVWKIITSETRFVLKQALAKLNVQADWYSDVERIEREEAAMRFLMPLLPESSIPQIMFEDDKEHLYIMACAPEGASNWKSLLMAGQFSPAVARNTGALLRQMHINSRTAEGEQIDVFRDISYFQQLRIEPFYVQLKQRYPQLEVAIDRFTNELTTDSSCLVHGDFSPKNMLVDASDDIILLDYEVSHWGNPVFDVAFLLTHLLLKGWGLRRERDSYLLIQAFLTEYQLETKHLLPHVGLLLLARLDGKSPVDYIKDEKLKHKIRSHAFEWIESASVTEPLLMFDEALTQRGNRS